MNIRLEPGWKVQLCSCGRHGRFWTKRGFTPEFASVEDANDTIGIGVKVNAISSINAKAIKIALMLNVGELPLFETDVDPQTSRMIKAWNNMMENSPHDISHDLKNIHEWFGQLQTDHVQ